MLTRDIETGSTGHSKYQMHSYYGDHLYFSRWTAHRIYMATGHMHPLGLSLVGKNKRSCLLIAETTLNPTSGLILESIIKWVSHPQVTRHPLNLGIEHILLDYKDWGWREIHFMTKSEFY